MYNFVLIFFVIFTISFVFCAKITQTTSEFSRVATTNTPAIGENLEKSAYEKGLEDYDEKMEHERQARGMSDEDDLIDYHHHHHEEPKKEEPKATAVDPWQSYYDFIINEGSFKFWAVFQLVTAVLLIYSAFAAVYYAKFNVITTDYDYYDDFYGRSRANTEDSSSIWSGLSSQTFQRIMDALGSKKYS